MIDFFHQRQASRTSCFVDVQKPWNDSASSCTITGREGCWVHGCFGGSNWFQASFRPTHLKAIVNLETGKGWERNMKRERKSERGKTQLFFGQGYLEGKQVKGRRRTSRISGWTMFKYLWDVFVVAFHFFLDSHLQSKPPQWTKIGHCREEIKSRRIQPSFKDILLCRCPKASDPARATLSASTQVRHAVGF